MERLIKIILLLSVFLVANIFADEKPDKTEVDDVQRNSSLSPVFKVSSFADEAIGVMDKGQFQNLTMNYGQITDTRYADVGNAPSQFFYNFRYPRKNYTGVTDDYALFFAIPENSMNGNNGNVIDGWTDNDNEDWVAKDGSYGLTHYNPANDPNPHAPILFPPDNPTTPYLASSDLPATWPVNDTGEAFWPGYFRRDATSGEEVDGEFASDRDVYAVFTDGNNQQGHQVGLEVEMMAYCYGRPYADKFQFYEFFIHNKSGKRLDSCYVGHYEDPDCSDYGEEILVLPDDTFSDPNISDIIMQRDIDGDLGGATRANSVGVTEDFTYGSAILETPKDMGVTDFHYYQDSGPTNDAILWPIISSNPTDANIASFSTQYFHGTNRRIDDVELIYSAEKQDLVYVVASGPFSLEPDEMVKYTFVVAIGENDADFYAQIEQAQQMFEFNFIGPSAPPAPTLQALAGDGNVTLYWDSSPESTPDAFTNEIDFEGYRIYRSEDNGQTWGDEVKDALGNLIGYYPKAQFDLENDILGVDPQNPFTYLGDDSGLKHTFVDNDVKNGITYSYTIVSYDRGSDAIYSLESARGTTIADRNFATMTPGSRLNGVVPSSLDSVYHLQGSGKGEISISVVDEAQLTDNAYEISFSGIPAQSFSITNTFTGDVLGSNLPLNYADNPVVEGFQVQVTSSQELGGIETVTDGFGVDVISAGAVDSSKSWLVASIAEKTGATLENRSHDYEVRFVDSGDYAYGWGLPASSTALFQTNIEVWDVTEGVNQKICFEVKDVNNNSQWDEGENIMIVNVPYPNPQPGDGLVAVLWDDFPYEIVISNATQDSLRVPPQTGDIVRINSKRSYTESDNFSFEFNLPEIDETQVDLKRVRVVPNPYIVGAEWEELQNVHEIHFTNLPPECTINIYTVSGDRVWSKKRSNYSSGDEAWNTNNSSNQALAFGVYVYVVTTPKGKKQVGKFSIIR